MKTKFFLALGAIFLYVIFSAPVFAAGGPVIANNFILSGSYAPLGASLIGQNAVTFQNGIYTFTFTVGSVVVAQYEIDTNDQNIKNGLLKIKDALNGSYPVIKAGIRYRTTDQNQETILTPEGFTLKQGVAINFSHTLWPNSIASLYYEETLSGITTQKQYDIEIVGGTLVIRARAVNPGASPYGNYAGFQFNESDNTPNSVNVGIPDMRLAQVTMVGGSYFLSKYFDLGRSHSNGMPWAEGPSAPTATTYKNSYMARYLIGENNSYPTFDETIYITVSKNVEDAFLNINRPIPAHRNLLSDKVVLDSFRVLDLTSGYGGYYQKVYQFLVSLHDTLRVDKLAVLTHTQYLIPSIGVAYPKSYPSDPIYGSVSDIKAVSDLTKSYGNLFAPLQEDYADFFIHYKNYWQDFCINDGVDDTRDPKNQNITQNPVILDASGFCKVGGWWSNDYQNGSHFYGITPEQSLYYAQDQGTQIAQEISPSAAYLDVSPKLPWYQIVNLAASSTASQTFQGAISYIDSLISYKENTNNGPVFGEGGQSVYNIDSFVDANVEGEIEGREFAPIIPNYDLKIEKPRVVKQGMGLISRWIDNQNGVLGNAVPDFTYAKYLAVRDKYNATAIALNRAGYIEDNFLFHYANLNPKDQMNQTQYTEMAVKQFFAYRDLQSQYLNSPAQDVLYLNAAGALVDLNQILKEYAPQLASFTDPRDNPFYNAKVKLTYQNGLVIYINRSQSQNWTVTESNIKYYLPPNGWLALNNSQNFIEYSALVDANNNPSASGHRVDYVKSINYIMIDGRGVATNFGKDFSGNSITASGMKVFWPDNYAIAQITDGSWIVNKTPVITSLSPNAIVNDIDHVVTINGANFTATSKIFIQGYEWYKDWTTYYSPQKMAFLAPANAVDVDGLYDVSVYNTEFNQESAKVTLTVTLLPPPPPPPNSPSAPTNLTVQEIFDTQIKLQWHDSSSDETGFKVESSLNNLTFSEIADIGANSSTYTASNLNANTGYYFRVRAYNTAGNSPYSNTIYIKTSGEISPPPLPPPPTPSFTVNLYLGITHPQASLLQECLKKDTSIYPQGIVSGYFGSLTESAVQKFQLKYGITYAGSAGYGYVGPLTREKLNSYCAGQPQPPAPPPTSGSTPFTKDLFYGLTDAQVTTLQQFLAKTPAIYPEGLVTGYFGSKTQAAVIRFQAKYGIATVGRVGPITRAKLNQLYSVGFAP